MIDRIMVTRRFIKEFAGFKRAFPAFEMTFEEFARTKVESDGRALFGIKDRNSGRISRLYWHAHLIFGKAIVHYRVDGGALWICRVTDHLVFDSEVDLSAMRRFVEGLTDDDYVRMPMRADAEARTLSPAQTATVRDLVYEIAADPGARSVLRDLIAGEPEDAMEFIRLVIDDPWTDAEKDHAALAAFGGIEGLRRAASKALRDMGITESVDEDAAVLAEAELLAESIMRRATPAWLHRAI